jgi:hypothetical protein
VLRKAYSECCLKRTECRLEPTPAPILCLSYLSPIYITLSNEENIVSKPDPLVGFTQIGILGNAG